MSNLHLNLSNVCVIMCTCHVSMSNLHVIMSNVHASMSHLHVIMCIWHVIMSKWHVFMSIQYAILRRRLAISLKYMGNFWYRKNTYPRVDGYAPVGTMRLRRHGWLAGCAEPGFEKTPRDVVRRTELVLWKPNRAYTKSCERFPSNDRFRWVQSLLE